MLVHNSLYNLNKKEFSKIYPPINLKNGKGKGSRGYDYIIINN